MNATFRFAVKACLLAAASGAVFTQAIGLVAQDTAPTIRRTAGVQGGSAAPQSAAPQGNSEVQKQLQELYRKNGREMPSMNMDDMPGMESVPSSPGPAGIPNQAPPSQAPPAGPAAAPSRAPVKPGKPNWFERLFHVGRGRRQQPQPVAQPTRPPAPATRQPQQRYMATQQPPQRPAAPTYRAPIATTTPAPQAQAPQTPAQPGLREPAPIGAPTDPSSLAARPGTPAVPPGERNGVSAPLLDESDDETDDADSLDTGRDDQPKFVNQAPQIRPSEPQTPKAPDSPYTGLTISPNEMEQKVAAAPQPNPATASPPAADASQPSDTSTAAPKAAASLMDEDDDDDDDESLTLPFDDAGKAPRKPAETEKSHAPAIEVRAADKPTGAKETEKRTAPLPMKGFRGFCPVALKDERKLIEARDHIQSVYHGKSYTFSSFEAKEAFDENPDRYVPAGEGNDVVRLSAGASKAEGSIEHAAWYRGRLYLFSSAETRREFVETPGKFMIED